jgi:hypothetical protein
VIFFTILPMNPPECGPTSAIMRTMTHAQPPSGPDIAPVGTSSAGPSQDMREQFAVLAAIDPATADTPVSGIAPTPTQVVADTRTALANTGDAGGPRYTFEAVFGAGGLSQIRRAL